MNGKSLIDEASEQTTGDLMERHHVGTAMFRSPGFGGVVALVCLTSSSCYGYASIERRSGPTVEARIDRSDSENLYVTLEGGAQQQTLSRADVLDISHPGKAPLATGVMIAVAGASMLVYGLVHQSCSGARTPQEDCGFDLEKLMWIQGGALVLLAGGSIATAGGFAYHNSVTAAEAPLVSPSRQAMQRSLPRLRCTVCSR
jgi:hypothetical protein